MKKRVGMHLVCYYYPCLRTFSSYHPYLLLQIFSCLFSLFFWLSNKHNIYRYAYIAFTIQAEMLWGVAQCIGVVRKLGHSYTWHDPIWRVLTPTECFSSTTSNSATCTVVNRVSMKPPLSTAVGEKPHQPASCCFPQREFGKATVGSSRNAILLLCVHAQGVRAPLTITPRPRLLCRVARSRVSIDDTIASRSRVRARASQESSQIDLATIALYFSMTYRGNSRVIILRLLVLPWTGCLAYWPHPYTVPHPTASPLG